MFHNLLQVFISLLPKCALYPVKHAGYIKWLEFLDVYQFLLAELISLTLKMESICSFETSVDTQQTTRTQRYNPEDNTLHNHHCENLKSYIIIYVLILSFFK
jgi:hypothetical protein